MKRELLDILACPVCLDSFEAAPADDAGRIASGSLRCSGCGAEFPILDDVPLFGLSSRNEDLKRQELEGELEWVSNANDIVDHVDFAVLSSQRSQALAQRLIERMPPKKPDGQPARVLDLGAGWGAFQAWQLTRLGYSVVAAELCPEFMLASDTVARDAYFERVVADGALLPFRDGIFDVVLCKEVLHHLEKPGEALAEIQRVAVPGAQLVASEPCLSVLKNRRKHREADIASQHGITHFLLTFGEYRNLLREVSRDVSSNPFELTLLSEKSHPVFARLQNLLLWATRKPAPIKDAVDKLIVTLLGGHVEFLSAVTPRNGANRSRRATSCVPHDLERLDRNRPHVDFYRNELIPAVFEVFRRTQGQA